MALQPIRLETKIAPFLAAGRLGANAGPSVEPVWGKETRFGWTVVLTIMAGVVQTARFADLFAVPAPLRLRSSARPRWR
jgi:hypothetical protein